MANSSTAYPENGPYIAYPPSEGGGSTPPATGGGITDDQIKAQYPWVPWSSMADGGKAVLSAIRNAISAGTNVNQAAWTAIRSDPGFSKWMPGFNEWANYAGADPGDYTSLAAFNSAKSRAAVAVNTLSPALRNIFSPQQLAILKSGNVWDPANGDLFGFFDWAQRNFHYYTDPQFTAFHGPPTYETLHSAFVQGIEGSDLQYGWSVQQQQQQQAQSEARADARSAQSQAEAEARSEANRKQRIETAATRIEQGYDPAVAALFTKEELHNAAIWDAGGEWGDGKASKLLQLSSPLMQMYRTYYGRDITRADLDQYYASGATADTVKQDLSARGFQVANQADIQYYTGAFGEGPNSRMSPDQVYQMGLQQAGGVTQFGQLYANKFEQAVQRARTAFQGTVAHLERSNTFGSPRPPDVAA